MKHLVGKSLMGRYNQIFFTLLREKIIFTQTNAARPYREA